jgi:hypothetical protein
MKKLVIIVALFATGASIGMEKMNTMPGSNPMLTKAQYDRIIDRWESIVVKEEQTEALLNKTNNENERKLLENKLEMLKKRDNDLDDIINGKPYRAYTNKELDKLLWE